MTSLDTRTVTVDGIGPVPLTVDDRGAGRPYLLLHGGGGPQTVTGFADLLADRLQVRVLTPVHPGFGGTPRPAVLDDVRGLARLYAALLDELDLHDVTVVGNSIGGWIAAEIGALRPPAVADLVLVDPVGLDVPGHPPVDFFSLRLDQIADYSYHDPDRFRIDPSALPPEAQAAFAGNREALTAYAGTAMVDPTLADRLADIVVPTLVVYGDADRIVEPPVGIAFADAIPDGRFLLLPDTGHLPQLETPELLLDVVAGFTGRPGRVSIVAPGEGETIQLGPVTMRLVETGSTTSHRLGLGEITIPPHSPGPEQHRHAKHDEGFYVVSGTARFTVGTESYDAGPGTAVMVPPGAPHSFENAGDEPVVLLNTFTPDLYVQYFRDLGALFAKDAMSPAAGEEVMARYATEPATTYAEPA